MSPAQKAAFVAAQTEMMRVERLILEAELAASSPQVPPARQRWEEFHQRWEAVLGYNALITFFRD